MNCLFDLKAARSFLESIFTGTEGFIEIRCLPSRKQLFSRGQAEIAAFIEKHTDENIYYGVCTRKDRDGSKAGVKEFPALWVDIDWKDFKGGQEEADRCLQTFSLKPSIVVMSGHGYHLYWNLKKPVEARPEIEAYLKGLAQAVRADASAAELARVLRVPGTYNHKYLEKVLVTFTPDNGLRYSLADFKPYRTGTTGQAPARAVNFSESLPQVDLYRFKLSARIKELIENGWRKSERGYRSRSEADEAVIIALLAASATPDDIRAIFTNCAIGEKYREKRTSGDAYLAHSIESATKFLESKSEGGDSMDKKESFRMEKEDTFPLQTIKHTQSKLGYRAVVAYVSNGSERFRDEVKLWSADSRTNYAEKCIKTLNGNLPPVDADKLRQDMDRWLRDEETRLKKIEEEKRKPVIDSTNATSGEMTEAEKEQAAAFLRDPALLFKVGKILEESLGLVGETSNALLLYLVLTSRLMQHIISVAIKAESSAGKSFLLETVLKLFPPEAYLFISGMSKQALVYSNEDYRHRMIIVAEVVGMESADFNIRTLLSENRLIFDTVETNSITGEHQTRRLEKEGPTGLITTTTLSRLHPENETRFISLAVNESESQTLQVKLKIATEYERGNIAFDFSPWINAQKLLKRVEIRIPYAQYLAEHTPNIPLRIRRDFKKLLTFIEASATVHQYQRREIGEGVIEASLADYFIAKTLLESAFFGSLYGIHPNTKILMNAIRELYDNTGQNITTEELMDRLDWPKSKISTWAKPLKDYGWVENNGRGRPSYYHPGREVGSIAKLPSVEELAEHHMALVKDFKVIDPVSGQVIGLQDEGSNTQNVSNESLS